MDQAAGSPITWCNIIFGSVVGRDMILWPNRHLIDSPSVGDGVVAASFSQGCVQVSIYHRQGATNRPVNNSTQVFLGELVSLTYRNTSKEILTGTWPLMASYQVKEELTLNRQTQISLMEGLGSHTLSHAHLLRCLCFSHELLLHFLRVFRESHLSLLVQILSPHRPRA